MAQPLQVVASGHHRHGKVRTRLTDGADQLDARLLPSHVDAARTFGKVDFAALRTLLDRPPLVPALLGMQTDSLCTKGWSPDAQQPVALTNEERHVAPLGGRSAQEFAAPKARYITENTGLAD